MMVRAAFLLCLASPAGANLPLPQFGDAELTALVARVRSFLPMAKLLDGSNVPAETAAELAQPIVPDDVARAVVRRGMVSGIVQACGGDPVERGLLPMTAEARARGDLSQKQMAFVGILHGAMQNMVASSAPSGQCTATMLSDLETELKQPAFSKR